MRRFTVALMGLLGVGALGLVGYHGGKWLGVQRVIAASRQPYTIVMRDDMFNRRTAADEIDYDQPTKGTSYLFAQATDGSRAQIVFKTTDSMAPTDVESRKISSVASRMIVTEYPGSRLKTSIPLTAEEVAAFKKTADDPTCYHHPERAAPTDVVGEAVYAGLRVVRLRFRGATAVTEAWEAPALGCAVVYLKTEFLDETGKVSDATIRAATSVSLTEPEGWIFETAPSSEEVKPSTAWERLGGTARDGGFAASSLPAKLRGQDERYLKRWSTTR